VTREPATTDLRGAAVWITVLASLGAIAVLAWALAVGLSRSRPIGDGRDPATYGFDLAGLRDEPGLATSGHPRDFLPSLDRPSTIAGAEVAEYNRTHRRRPVVSADRVVGVSIGGESRAYPLPLLESHEVVNDELGGVPIAVSFSPLADAAVVFRREVGGRTREFALSGLLLDASHLLYDRSSPGTAEGASPSSLWSPIRGRAVSGPDSGTSIDVVPGVSLTTWSDWLAAHPETTVALGDEASRLRGRQINYARYLESPGVGRPVRGVARDEDAPKEPVLLLRAEGGAWRIESLMVLRQSADPGGWTEVSEPKARLMVSRDARGYLLGGVEVVAIPCLRFAADATVAAAGSESSEPASEAPPTSLTP